MVFYFLIPLAVIGLIGILDVVYFAGTIGTRLSKFIGR